MDNFLMPYLMNFFFLCLFMKNEISTILIILLSCKLIKVIIKQEINLKYILINIKKTFKMLYLLKQHDV